MMSLWLCSSEQQLPHDRENLVTCVQQIQTSNSEPEISKLINRFSCPFPFPSFHIQAPPPSIFVTSDIRHSSFHNYIRYHSFLMGWQCLSPHRWMAKPFFSRFHWKHQYKCSSHSFLCILHTFSFLSIKERSPMNWPETLCFPISFSSHLFTVFIRK